MKEYNKNFLGFDSFEIPTIQEKIDNQGFSDGLLQKLHNSIKDLTVAKTKVSNILEDFSQTVYGIAGLNDDLQDEEGEQAIIHRLYMMDQTRSNLRALVMDSNDTFDRKVANVSGIKELFSILKDSLTSESDMPHNLIHGESPGASLGESGQGQMIAWYDYIRQKQQTVLKPI